MDEEKVAQLIEARVQAALETHLKAQTTTRPQEDPSELAELRATLTREIEGRKQAEKRAREQAAYTHLRGALAGKVLPGLEDLVASNLQKVRDQVLYAKDGSVRLKVGQLDYDLDEGVEEYLRTDEARAFLPPPTPQPPKGARKDKTSTVQVSQPQIDSADPMARTLAILASHGVH